MPVYGAEVGMSEKILVADDEREIADLLSLYLRNEGFEVFKCYDGTEAVKIAGEEKLDLAILDIMMPGISGLEVCCKIREQYNYPIILLTAKG